MNIGESRWLGPFALFATVMATSIIPASAQQQQAKPNIILIVSDDFGYGDAGVYGGGPGRGMPTPNIDRLASEGMTFFTFYAQPSCTPGRAAMQGWGRTPRRKNFFDGRTDTSLHPQLSARMHGHLCGAKNEAAIVRSSSGVRCAIVAVSFAGNQ